MKLHFLGLGFGLIVSSLSPALAVEPPSITASDNVAWSKVVESPFDGKIVYDRNYQGGAVFVSSWAKSGIRATYTQASDTLVGYDRGSRGVGLGFGFGRRSRGFGLGLGFGFPDSEPVYQRSLVNSVPDSISLAINGRIYTYQNGPVSPELAAALSSAPRQNLKVRLVWKDGSTRDTEIGRGTVQAWKTIFQS